MRRYSSFEKCYEIKKMVKKKTLKPKRGGDKRQTSGALEVHQKRRQISDATIL